MKIKFYILFTLASILFSIANAQYVEKSEFWGIGSENYIIKSTQKEDKYYISTTTNTGGLGLNLLYELDTTGNVLQQIFIGFEDIYSYYDFEVHNNTAYVLFKSFNGNSFNNYSLVYKKIDLTTGLDLFIDTLTQASNNITPLVDIELSDNADDVFIFFNDFANSYTNYLNNLFNLTISGPNGVLLKYNNLNDSLVYSSKTPIILNKVKQHDNKFYFNTSEVQPFGNHHIFDYLTNTLLNSDTVIQEVNIFNFGDDNQLNLHKLNNKLYTHINNFGENYIKVYDTLLTTIDSIYIGDGGTNIHSFIENNHIYTTIDSANNMRFKVFDLNGVLKLSKTFSNLHNPILTYKSGFIHMVSNGKNFTTTNGTLGSLNSDALVYTKLDTLNYDICNSTYIGGIKQSIKYRNSNNGVPYLTVKNINFLNNKLHVFGESNLDNIPRTTSSNFYSYDIINFLYVFNTDNSDLTSLNDTLSPKTQTSCKNGLAENIVGQEAEIQSSNNIPLVYLGNNSYEQTIHKGIEYQWQEALNINGPFIDIPNANSKDYLPTVGVENKYYRRIITLSNCEETAILISDTASVLINNNFAPEVEVGDIHHTCPNVNVTVGSTPTVTGGTPPYQYNWSNGANTATTIVNSNKNELLTLIVTDANGCKQYDQASVLVHQANIKITESVCAGDSAIIRANTIQGLPGVTYLWTGNNMCCPSSANNIVAPTNSQTYILTQTIPITNGGFCNTNDTTLVEYVNAPPANFAGPDQLACLGSKVTVGNTPINGFNYSWAVSSDARISPSNSAQAVLTNFYDNTTYNQTNYFTNLMPNTNPLPVIAYMQKNNCLYTDTAHIAYMEATDEDFRVAYCDASLIGSADRTPNINETYSWTRLNGNAQIIGSSNQAQLQIDNTNNTNSSIFQLTATATVNGISNTCTNNVTVFRNYTKRTSSTSCFPITYKGITYTNDAVIWDTIPSTSAFCDTIHKHEINITNCVDFCEYESNGIKTITATYSLPYNQHYNYDWSIESGPTNNFFVINNGKVEVHDDIYRQIKLSITSPNDTSLLLEYFIDVNGGNWNPISYTALDTTLCYPAGSIQIGDPNGSGYSYRWYLNSSNHFSTSRNPTVTPPNIGINNYRVRVTRGGCSFNDYATINVLKLDEKYAGTDIEVCENSIIKLGGINNPINYQYTWEPSSAIWQNGTDSSSANPEVLVAVSADYIVHVTDEDNFCTASDTVSVTVNNTPTLDIPDFNICKNEDTIIGMPNFSGATFSWSPAIGLSCTDCFAPTVNLENSQTYTVNILFDGNCINPNYTDIVNVNVVEVNSNMQDISYCPDGSIVSIGSDAPSGMNNYSWSPQNLLNTPNNRISNVRNPNGQTTQSFYLNFKDNNQCEVFDTVDIIPVISTPPVNAGFNQTICLGKSVNIGQQNFSATANYSWSPTTDLSNFNTSYTTFTPQDTGLYTFVLTKEELGANCISTDTVSIQVTSVEVNDLNYQICQNTCSLIGFTNNPNYDYVWSPSNNLSSNNMANPTICNLNSTQNYNVEVSNQYGCVDNATVNVGVFNYTPPTVTLNDTIVFTNTTFSLNTTVNPIGNSIFEWENSPYILDRNTAQGLFNFNQTGVYNFTLEITDINSGCTSTENVNITVLELNIVSDTIFACDSFIYKNQTYTSSQIFQDTILIDSIITYEYILHQSQQASININFCDSIEINNQWFFNDTVLVDSLQTSFGCDSIFTTHLIYAESKKDTLEINFCDSTFYNGNWYFNSQNIVENLQTAANCDSTFTAILNASFSFEKDSNIVFCDSTFFNGNWYFNSQQFTFNGQTSNGCDSIINFYLIKNSTDTAFAINFCDSILFNNTWFFDDDTIIQNLQTSFGCDSIVTTHLFYAESKKDTLEINFCDSTFYNGNWYFNSQNIVENHQTAANCDSTFSAILNASFSFEKDSNIVFCDSTFFNGNWYFNSQQFTFNGQTSNGCDSTINFYLIKNSTDTAFAINFCDSILFNSTWYYDDDTIIQNLQTSFGCDSVVTTTLIKNISSPVTKMDTSFCANENFEFILGNNTITSAGNYSHTFTNQNGCDSLVELLVIEKPIQLFDESILDTTVCFGDTLVLNLKIILNDSLNYTWEYANNTSIVLTESYTDLLTITHPNSCQQTIPLNAFFKDCVGPCKLMLPTGFSPNNDGVNDQLVIFNDCRYGIEKFNIKVYNRWGELVFESDDMLNTWDGYYKNQPAPLGVYTYHITYTKVASDKTDTLSGNVTLIK